MDRTTADIATIHNNFWQDADMKLLAMLMLTTDLNGQSLPDVVLLDFHADYCGPCQQMAPIIDRMERRKFPIKRVDFGASPEISRKFGVTRIPTFIVLVKGQEQKRFVGLTSEQELCEAIQSAADQLGTQRKAQPPEPAEKEKPTSGVGNFFDRIRNRLTPEEDTPEYRGQTPEPNASAGADIDAEMRATVRIRLTDGRNRDFGTGTIVHSTAGHSTILTCAHIFKGVDANAAVTVDLFRDGKVLNYPATVLGGDHRADIAFIQVKNAQPLPQIPLAQGLQLKAREPVFSIGCNGGEKPTRMNMNVVQINKFTGPENILCTNAPPQGRSGGGLFDTQGQLVGVCSGAFKEESEGLYNGVANVWKLAQKLKLPFATNGPTETNPIGIAVSDRRVIEQGKNESSNPFDSGESIFDQMVENELQEFQRAMQPGPTDRPGSTNPTKTVSATTENLQSSPAAAGVKEVTVIIKSTNPDTPDKVVVIPQPSSWLLQLLTGDKSLR